MTTWQVVWSGVMFGLGVAVPIGPVNVEIARRALFRGWFGGVALGLGACTVDMVYACVAAVGAAGVVRLAANGALSQLMAVASVCLLGWMGWGSFKAGWAASRNSAPLVGEEQWVGGGGERVELPGTRAVRGYLTGLVMTAVNPMTLVFWFVGLPGLVMGLGLKAGEVKWWVVGVFCGALSWVLVFSGVMAGLGRWRKAWWMVVADVVGGAVLVGYAVAAGVKLWKH